MNRSSDHAREEAPIPKTIGKFGDDLDNAEEDGSNSSGLLNRESSHDGSSSGTGTGHPSSTTDSLRSGSVGNRSSISGFRDSTVDLLRRSSNVCSLRILVVLLFLTMSIYIPLLIYRTTSENEEQSFRREYDDLASKVINSFDFQMSQQLQAMDSIDISMTSYTSHSTEVYPKVTMPDFDLVAANTLALAGTAAIWLVPFVEDETAVRQDWEMYSVDQQEWIDTAVHRKLPDAMDRDDEEEEDSHSHGHSQGDDDHDHRRRRGRRTSTRDDNLQKFHQLQGSGRRHLDGIDHEDPFQQEIDGIAEEISQFDETTGNLVAQPADTGPYFPIWQNAPVFEDVINVNINSLQTFQESIQATVASKMAVLGSVVEFTESEAFFKAYMNRLVEALSNQHQEADGHSHGEESDHGHDHDVVSEPVSMMMYPIFDDFDKNQLVGLFAMTVYWHSFFEGVLPDNAEGLVCVIENACDQAFTYRINGRSTIFEGLGDLHDGSFESLAKDWVINEVQSTGSVIPMNKDFCPYTLTVYPSKELEAEFLTYRPTLYTTVVALSFVLIFAVAVTYDCVVQRRLKAVLNTALESRAIISSLFPENVRDRLFVEQNEENQLKKSNSGKKKEALFGDPANDPHALHPAKLRLKNFLDESPAGDGNAPGAPSELTILQSKPIADLFPNCTVLFADIAGFTAWSSEREPAQVFTLLQTIFHYFDNIAKKWGVFKVETIGDCYVAVTGLPDPQPDHAVRMAKFARESLRVVSGLTHKLETSLGPDTGDLMMRFGMHSGPVTAGVLRGEKSRFQLFGDTVNLASRMENTGKSGAIQISPTTADLLEEAGKSGWLTPREDLITAKGKGRIQTYWVAQGKREGNMDESSRGPTGSGGVTASGASNTKLDMKSTSLAAVSEVSNGDDEDANPHEAHMNVAKRFLENQSTAQSRKLQRLIDWQTEILARLLRSIVAQRSAKKKKKDVTFISDPVSVLKQNQQEGVDCVLDEVAEVLRLPEFDDKKTKHISPNSVELSPAVMSQLRDYVLLICSKYKGNPFHNFEHASHVTMSSSKLLSRIVVPENVNYQRDNKKAIASDLHDFTYGITSDPLTQFAAIFCSLIHDVDHQGVSNFQLGNEQPDMATKYKNRSLAEQNSVDIAWDLLMQPEFRNLQQCIFATEEELQRFRQLVVNLVMATDIFDKQFKELRNSRWQRAFHDKTSDEVTGQDRFDLRSTIVIEHIIQAADVAHTMQHWHVYTKWNERLFNEMYLAFENGRSPKDPSEGWYKGELWFFDNYVIPLGKKLDECNVFGVASDEGLNYALANRAEWAIKGEEIVQDMLRRYKESKPAAPEQAAS